MIVTNIAIAAAGPALPIPQVFIIIGVIAAALVLAIGSFWLFRSSGKKKKGAKVGATGGASDWQRQAQQGPGAPGAWNQQANPAAGNWGQQQQPQQPQQPGAWGQQQQPG